MFQKGLHQSAFGVLASVIIGPAFLSISAMIINVSYVLQASLVLYISGSSSSSVCLCFCDSSCFSVALFLPSSDICYVRIQAMSQLHVTISPHNIHQQI